MENIKVGLLRQIKVRSVYTPDHPIEFRTQCNPTEWERGAHVEYNDPFFASVGRGRRYALNMICAPLERFPEFDCVVIVTDHSQYDYAGIVHMTKQVVDTRNASKDIAAVYIVRCRSIDVGALAGTDLMYLRFFTLPPFTVRLL